MKTDRMRRSRTLLPSNKMSKSIHNKQRDMRAASLRRIAKAIRASMKRGLPYQAEGQFIPARKLAGIFDDEAKLLRSMR